MLGPLVFGVAIAGTLFAAWECRKTWGWLAFIGVLALFLALTFVVPYGAFAVIAGSVALHRAASTSRFKKIAAGGLDDENELLDVFE